MAPVFPGYQRVVCVEGRPSVSFIFISGRSSTAIRPPRGVSISVIIALTIARRIGKPTRKGQPEKSAEPQTRSTGLKGAGQIFDRALNEVFSFPAMAVNRDS
jgi:hypothetical protein